MSAEIVLQQMIIIFLLIMTGYIVYKRGIIQNNVAKGISALVVNVCNPALLIRSACDHDASITYDKILYAVVGGAVLYAVLILASLFLPKLLSVGEKWKKHYAPYVSVREYRFYRNPVGIRSFWRTCSDLCGGI